MVARLRLLTLPALLVSLLTLVWAPVAWAEQPSAQSSRCNNATLKGTYLYNHSGVLNGKPYAESGREVYDGQGGLVLSYRGSDGSGGLEKATYSVSADCIGTASYPDGQKATSFLSPDGSRFVYTITSAPGSQPTALSGSEIRVDP
jgi:hypothetical protein